MVIDKLKCHIWHVHMSILTAVSYEIPDNKGKYCRWNENSHFLLWKRKKSEFSNKLCVGFLLYDFYVLQFQRSSLLLFFLVMQHSTWDLSSLTSEWILAPCSGSAESYHWTSREIPRSSFSRSAPLILSGILNRGNMQSSAVLLRSRGFFLRRTWHPVFQLAEKKFPRSIKFP